MTRKYIALLRGINVSGQKIIKMADLKLLFEALNFTDVITYIQSGNIIFNSEENDKNKIIQVIKDGIFKKFGHEVKVIVKEPDELDYILKNNPFINGRNIEPEKLAVVFLSNPPDKSNIKMLSEYDYPPEEYIIDEDILYYHSPNGFGRAKMSNNFFENKLKTEATTRNWKTVNKLLEIASN